LFRHWLLALVPILLVPLAGAYYVKTTSGAVAQVSANIWVNQSSNKQLSYFDPNAPPAQNMQGALTQLLQSASFDVQVAQQSPLYWHLVKTQPGVAQAVQADFAKNVAVGQAGPDIVTIGYTTKDPLLGLQVVQTILQSAPPEMQRLNHLQIATDLPAYQAQLHYAQTQLGQAATALHRYMSEHGIQASDVTVESLIDPRFATLYQAMQSAETNVQLAQEQLSAERVQGAAHGGFQVLDAPSVQILPASKKTAVLDVGIALVTGLLLAGAFVTLATALDHSVRFVEEVPEVLGLPILASVPYSPVLASPSRRRLLPNRTKEDP
jgi:capsular polysaccharide biosynthesis protein